VKSRKKETNAEQNIAKETQDTHSTFDPSPALSTKIGAQPLAPKAKAKAEANLNSTTTNG
jgi:hypothetical protein